MGHRIQAGRLTTQKTNSSIAESTQDDSRIVLGEISETLKKYLEKQEAEKQAKVEARTYSAPEDDIVEIGTGRKRKK